MLEMQVLPPCPHCCRCRVAQPAPVPKATPPPPAPPNGLRGSRSRAREEAGIIPPATRARTGPFFCPVPGCPRQTQGWFCKQSMRNHLDSHRIADIPDVWRQSQGLVPCAAGCHRLVARREGTVHPTCRARVRSALAATPAAAAAAAAAAEQPTEDRPSLEDTMGSRRPTL